MNHITQEQAAAIATKYALPQGLGHPHWPVIFHEVIKQYIETSVSELTGTAYTVRSDIDIHLEHCYQAPYETSCKYGDDDCPATPKAAQPAKPTQLLEVIRAYREYIDALPKDLVLPAMPGFDRDWADAVEAKAQPAKPVSQYGSPELQSLILSKLAQPAKPVELSDEQIDAVQTEWIHSGMSKGSRGFARAILAAAAAKERT